MQLVFSYFVQPGLLKTSLCDLCRQCCIQLYAFIECAADSITCGVKGPLVQIEIRYPCWFYRSEDPVLMCTVQTEYEKNDKSIIEWRRNDSLIAANGTPIDSSVGKVYMYNMMEYTTNAVKQERVHVISDKAFSSVLQQSEFSCATQGHISSNIQLHIPGKLKLADKSICL